MPPARAGRARAPPEGPLSSSKPPPSSSTASKGRCTRRGRQFRRVALTDGPSAVRYDVPVVRETRSGGSQLLVGETDARTLRQERGPRRSSQDVGAPRG